MNVQDQQKVISKKTVDRQARDASSKESLRNKGKLSTGDRKPAFKAVLESPYHVNWPSAPTSTTTAILKDLTTYLSDFVRRRKQDLPVTPKVMTADERRAMRKERREAKQKTEKNTGIDKTTSSVTPPSMLIGINAVTRDIEAGESSLSRIVFTCRSDVNPSRLLSHIPSHIAAHNSKYTRSVALIDMPKGSEEALAVSLDLKRVAVVSLTEEHPLTNTILGKLDDVSKYTLTAPWLKGDKVVYVPTKINMVETSIPKDMRKAKEEKKKVQAAKKERILAYKQTQKLKNK